MGILLTLNLNRIFKNVKSKSIDMFVNRFTLIDTIWQYFRNLNMVSYHFLRINSFWNFMDIPTSKQ